MANQLGIDAAELRRRRGQGGQAGQRGRELSSGKLFAKPTAATTLKPARRKFGEKPKPPMRLPGTPRQMSGRQQIFFQRSTKGK